MQVRYFCIKSQLKRGIQWVRLKNVQYLTNPTHAVTVIILIDIFGCISADFNNHIKWMYTTLFTGPILTQSLQDPPTTHHVMSANGMKIVNITCIRYQKIAFDMFLDLVTVCVNCDIFNIFLLQLHCLLELISTGHWQYFEGKEEVWCALLVNNFVYSCLVHICIFSGVFYILYLFVWWLATDLVFNINKWTT